MEDMITAANDTVEALDRMSMQDTALEKFYMRAGDKALGTDIRYETFGIAGLEAGWYKYRRNTKGNVTVERLGDDAVAAEATLREVVNAISVLLANPFALSMSGMISAAGRAVDGDRKAMAYMIAFSIASVERLV